jgi:hypothetical protein
MYAPFAVACLLASRVGAAQSEEPLAEVAPVIVARVGESIVIRYDFVNMSKKPIGYLLSNRGGVYLDIGLFKDGVAISPRETELPPVLAKNRVRTLKPGGFVRHEFVLQDRYGKIGAGRYRVQVKYSTSSTEEKEFGITAMSFERTLLWIEVKDDE